MSLQAPKAFPPSPLVGHQSRAGFTDLALPIDNLKIIKTVEMAMAGEIDVVDHQSGMCLKVVRQVLEHAFGLPDGSLYQHYVTKRVERNEGDSWDWWARDAERSLRALGMAVPAGQKMLPGDLLFYWKTAKTGTKDSFGYPNYYGHVGILMPGNVVFENINPKYRSHSFQRGMLALTPLRWWATPSTVVRFDPRTTATQPGKPGKN